MYGVVLWVFIYDAFTGVSTVDSWTVATIYSRCTHALDHGVCRLSTSMVDSSFALSTCNGVTMRQQAPAGPSSIARPPLPYCMLLATGGLPLLRVFLVSCPALMFKFTTCRAMTRVMHDYYPSHCITLKDKTLLIHEQCTNPGGKSSRIPIPTT